MVKTKKIPKGMIGLCFTAMLWGCVSPQPAPNRSTAFFDSNAASFSVPSEEGSLWSSKTASNFYADVKARNVGDIVTINIVESAKASKNATTNTERSSGLEANWSGLFDVLTGGFTIHGSPIGDQHKVDFANKFDGKGETTRSSYMSAYITARVVHVLPNGNLVIQGSRQVRLNNENQFIHIQGVIRPEDISSQNIILSTFISDAKIELIGQGAIGDKQRPGWLARALDWVWPF